MSEHLQMHLTVTEPFTDTSGKVYIRGDHIRDPERIADATRNFHGHVVQRIADDVHVDGSFYGDKLPEPLVPATVSVMTATAPAEPEEEIPVHE